MLIRHIIGALISNYLTPGWGGGGGGAFPFPPLRSSCIQWNLRIKDTSETSHFVHYREDVLFSEGPLSEVPLYVHHTIQR